MDASTTLAGVFDDAADAFAVRAGDYVAEHGAIVPALWRWEVQNTLLTAMRRGRISEDQLLAARSLLAARRLKSMMHRAFRRGARPSPKT
jgi:hypothetical protein